MSILRLLSHQVSEPEVKGSIVELIYASRALVQYLTWITGKTHECVCGTLAGSPENPNYHHNFCPVARYFVAVEAVRKAAL